MWANAQHLTFSDQISAISQACYYLIRQLRCIRPYLDSNTTRTIATSIVHSKLDYCNSLYYNLPKSQITRLQQIQNSPARAVVKAPKSCHITPIFAVLTGSKGPNASNTNSSHLPTKSSQSPIIHICNNLISVQPPRSTRSSSLVHSYSTTNIFLVTYN